MKRGDTSPEPWTEWFDLSKQEWYYGAIDRKVKNKNKQKQTACLVVLNKHFLFF